MDDGASFIHSSFFFPLCIFCCCCPSFLCLFAPCLSSFAIPLSITRQPVEKDLPRRRREKGKMWKSGWGAMGFAIKYLGMTWFFSPRPWWIVPGQQPQWIVRLYVYNTCTAPMKIKPVSLRQQQQQSAVVGSNFSLLYTLQINRLSELIIRFDVRPSTSPTKFFWFFKYNSFLFHMRKPCGPFAIKIFFSPHFSFICLLVFNWIGSDRGIGMDCWLLLHLNTGKTGHQGRLVSVHDRARFHQRIIEPVHERIDFSSDFLFPIFFHVPPSSFAVAQETLMFSSACTDWKKGEEKEKRICPSVREGRRRVISYKLKS